MVEGWWRSLFRGSRRQDSRQNRNCLRLLTVPRWNTQLCSLFWTFCNQLRGTVRYKWWRHSRQKCRRMKFTSSRSEQRSCYWCWRHTHRLYSDHHSKVLWNRMRQHYESWTLADQSKSQFLGIHKMEFHQRCSFHQLVGWRLYCTWAQSLSAYQHSQSHRKATRWHQSCTWPTWSETWCSKNPMGPESLLQVSHSTSQWG